MVNKVASLNLLDGVTIFVAVVNASSFTAAARALGCSTSHVSKAISLLEKRLNSRLINRTTRTLKLTDAGKAYFERCKQIVIDTEDAERSISQLQDSPRGLLRINVPVSFGLIYLRQYLSQFMQRYSEVTLEVEFNDRMIDVVAEGYDVVIRAGDNKDSNLVARKFMRSRGGVVASPEYIKRKGRPSNASELEQHDCISYSFMPNPAVWDFYKNDEHTAVNIKPRLICNNAELEVSMAVQGIGIARLPLFCCEQEISNSRLEILLDDYQQPDIDIYAVYPHRQYLTAKVRAFVDFLVEKFE